jgi:hypothetical protein
MHASSPIMGATRSRRGGSRNQTIATASAATAAAAPATHGHTLLALADSVIAPLE